MWWSGSEAHGVSGEPVERILALAGTVQRKRRTTLTMVPLASVQPNPEQPRRHFAEDKLAELAESIRERGLLQPIVVRRLPTGTYGLLAGERRFRAAQLAGIDRLPALIRDGDDPLEIALIENIQREDLAPLEEAEALASLIDRHGYSHREVADLLGKSRPYVSNILALNRLPDAVKADLHREGGVVSRELLMGIAREEDAGSALALWRRLKLDTMSVRRFRAERSGTEAAPRSPVHDLVLAARRLNRTIRRALAEDVESAGDVAGAIRVLRRTQRLVERELAALNARRS